MKAATMRAVRCHRFAALDKSGKPVSKPSPIRDVIQLEQVATPKPRNDGVLVSCHYAGIQYPDFLQAQVIPTKGTSFMRRDCISCFQSRITV